MDNDYAYQIIQAQEDEGLDPKLPEDYEVEICPHCQGEGGDVHSGTICPYCGGNGEIEIGSTS